MIDYNPDMQTVRGLPLRHICDLWTAPDRTVSAWCIPCAGVSWRLGSPSEIRVVQDWQNRVT